MGITLVTAAIGAFCGALFAFVVSQLNERVKRNRKRWTEHYNGLIELELIFNSILGVVGDNRALFNKFIKSYNDSNSRKTVFWNEPNRIPYDSSILNHFLDIELKNKLFSFGEKIRKYNHDIETVWQGYLEMRNSFLKKDITDEQYKISLKEYINGLAFLDKGCNLLDDRTIELHAYTRMAIKKDKEKNKGLFYYLPRASQLGSKELDDEMNLLKLEIKEVQTKSRNEIDTYLGKIL